MKWKTHYSTPTRLVRFSSRPKAVTALNARGDGSYVPCGSGRSHCSTAVFDKGG